MSQREKAQVLDEPGIERALTRIAHEIVERAGGTDGLALVGVRTRGVSLARRISARLQAIGGQPVPVGALDITLYRDDLALKGEAPILRATEIPFSVADKTIVLVDDVLSTGRTTRAALDAIIALGPPRMIQLAVLVIGGTASSRSGRTTWGRTCRRRTARPSRFCSTSTTDRTAS